MRNLLLTGLTVLSCGAPARTTPESAFEVSVTATPARAAQGDSVTVVVRITNPGPAAVTLQFRNTCVVTFEIRDGSDRLVAPMLMCGQAITDHTFPPGVSQRSFVVVIGSPDYPLAPGAYNVLGGLGRPFIQASTPTSLTIVNRDLE